MGIFKNLAKIEELLEANVPGCWSVFNNVLRVKDLPKVMRDAMIQFGYTENALIFAVDYVDEENDDQAELFFIVPKNWLWEYVKETEYKTLNNFLNEYTWDNSEPIYYEAKENNVIIKEWEA